MYVKCSMNTSFYYYYIKLKQSDLLLFFPQVVFHFHLTKYMSQFHQKHSTWASRKHSLKIRLTHWNTRFWAKILIAPAFLQERNRTSWAVIKNAQNTKIFYKSLSKLTTESSLSAPVLMCTRPPMSPRVKFKASNGVLMMTTFSVTPHQ